MTALTALLAVTLANPDCIPPCADPPGLDVIRLFVGTQKLLPLAEDETVRLEGTGPELKPIGKNQLLVIGAERGISQLIIEGPQGTRRFKVRVRQLGIDECGISLLYKLLPCDAGFDVQFEGDRVTVTGRFRTLDEWLKVLPARREHWSVDWPGVPPEVIAEAEGRANDALKAAGLAVRVKAIGRGFVVSPADAKTLARAAEVLAPHRETLRDTLTAPPYR